MELKLYVFDAMTRLAETMRYEPEGRGFDSRWLHWNFSNNLILPAHYDAGVDSDYNRNEYQEYFLGVKATGAKG
jgi:hypothetical protein